MSFQDLLSELSEWYDLLIQQESGSKSYRVYAVPIDATTGKTIGEPGIATGRDRRNTLMEACLLAEANADRGSSPIEEIQARISAVA
jgi:hypothetical protein